MNYAELQQAIREASGYLLSEEQVKAIAVLAVRWAEASAAAHTRKLSGARPALPASQRAPGAADAAESRAMHAERQLARFADQVARYEELDDLAGQAQRNADLVTELRRRVAVLERQGSPS